MPENPYAPPTSEVADVESENGTMERPRIVTQGIWLLWVYLVISLPAVILEGFVTPTSTEDDPDRTLRTFQTAATVVSIVLIAVMALLTWFAWKGRNWARITHLVLLTVGVLMSGLAMVVSYWLAPEAEIFSDEWYLSVLFVLQSVLNAAGVLLLFTSAANAWYRAMRAARARNHFTGLIRRE
jgi:cation transport ATPase